MKHLVIGIFAQVDAGKTTLSEALLYRAGALRKLGRVDHGDAFLDHYSLERARGITIFSKQARFSLGDTEITLLDTPGHVDFSPEAERAMHGRRAGAHGNALAASAALRHPDLPVFQQNGPARRRPRPASGAGVPPPE